MAAQTERGIPLSALSPKFLHTNSTSHTWPFSAIAELIDNAYDPDVSAKQFWIDKTRIKGLDCLTFMDNGSGINYDKMHKMLSFGFSDKQTINGHIPVGLYGNGFKSGSMRLGKDALVFSKTRDTMSVGLLSQSYLEAIQAQHVVVPIVTFRRVGQNQFRAASEHTASLQDILRYSLFKSENELFSELRAINSTCSTGSTGTRIIIWNLRRMSNGLSEFDFNKDRYDIQIPADVFESTSEMYKRQDRAMQSVPESDYSLRAYCSILYLKPRMQIVIRGQKVKTQLISKSLAYIAKDHYRPIFLNKRIRITFGYNTKSKEQYGIMMYHKNRLIKAYERVGCQLKANIKGVGVIGVIECNFLKPTHNKQDFDYTDEYRKTINNLGVKLEEYWNEIRYKRDREDPNCSIPVEDTMKRPDQNWVQCDNCLRWRKLPDGIDCSLLPEKWFCHMNPDPQFRTCQVEEEPEDSDDDQPSYQKTYKQQERYNKMQQERSRLQMEQAKKKADMQRIAALAEQNEVLRRQHEDLKRQLKQSNFRATIPPNTPATPSISSTVRGELRPLVTSTPLGHKASCSPSANNMPIISNVCSLSTPARMKRTAMNPDSMEMKRARISSLHSSTAEATDATVSTEPPSSPVIIPSDDDDDIVIIETNSTPRPGAPTFDLAKVKTEHKVTEVTGMHLECSDDAAVETPMETEATPKARSPSPLPQLQTSATTQTESAARVKEEDEAKRKKEEGTTAGKETTPQEEQCGNNIDVTANTSEAEVEEVAVKEETKGQLDERQDEEEEKGEEVASVEQGELQPEQENVDDVAVTETESVVERVAPMEGMAVIEAEQKEERLLLEAQQQQDQLMELMQATAQERDGYKEQVHQLTCRIVDLETQLLELTGSVVKKELCDQATATDWLEGEEEGAATPGSKSEQELSKVCQQAKQEVEELKQHQEAFGTSRFGSTSSYKINSEERGATEVSDEDVLALQVDTLLRDLDHCSKEREDLQRRLESMEAEKNNLSSQCELLQKELRERAAANKPGSPTSGDVDQTGPGSPTSGDVDQTGPGSPTSGDVDQTGPGSPTSGDVDQTGPGSPTSGDVDQIGPGSPASRGVDQNGTGNHSGAETQNGATSLTSAEIQNGVSSPVAGAVTPVPSDETTRKLRNLRMSIGRLLVTFVPALELDQVNYDCEVIDEILDQVLDEVSLTETA